MGEKFNYCSWKECIFTHSRVESSVQPRNKVFYFEAWHKCQMLICITCITKMTSDIISKQYLLSFAFPFRFEPTARNFSMSIYLGHFFGANIHLRYQNWFLPNIVRVCCVVSACKKCTHQTLNMSQALVSCNL